MKTRFEIRLEQIFGRGGSMPIARLGEAGEGRVEGCSVGDMVKAERMVWGEYRLGGKVKRALEMNGTRRYLM